MCGVPDRHPATFAAKPPEIVLKPLTLPAVLTFENAVLLDERGAKSPKKRCTSTSGMGWFSARPVLDVEAGKAAFQLSLHTVDSAPSSSVV